MISEEDLRRIYWDEGMSIAEIDHEINVLQQTVWYWMKKYGIERRSNTESQILKSLILSQEDLEFMYLDKKMSTAEIGCEIDVNPGTVRGWMKKYGIETRTISEGLLNGDFSGERSGAWKNGLSFGKYCKKFNNQFKEAVRLRDDYTCQKCGYKQNGQKLDVHHIHYDKENCYPDVVALCHPCNGKVNSDRDEWEKCFEEDLARRGLLNWSVDT